MNRSFFGLLRASLLRPSTPFFGTCFVWQQRGSRRQVSLTRSTAYARPAGAVTASHWRCDCDRSFCAPESRLWAVCREERPTGRGKPTPPSRATAKAEKHRQNPWVALDRRAQPRVRLTPTLVSNEHKPRCLWMAKWLPCAQQRARASDECLLDQRNTELGRKKS